MFWVRQHAVTSREEEVRVQWVVAPVAFRFCRGVVTNVTVFPVHCDQRLHVQYQHDLLCAHVKEFGVCTVQRGTACTLTS